MAVGPRLKDIVLNKVGAQITATTPSLPTIDGILDRLHHFNVSTLPHLLALIIHPPSSFPPPGTSLIVIDCVSSLFALAFPRSLYKNSTNRDSGRKNDALQWAASRRWAVMGDFISKIGEIAATSNIAVLLINQSTTRIRADTETVLHPAISGTAWDNGIHARIALFRDWISQSTQGSSHGSWIPRARFAGVIKAAGVTYGGIGKVVPFQIKKVRNFSVHRQ